MDILPSYYHSFRIVPLETWQLFWAKSDRDGKLGRGPEWTHPLWAHLLDVTCAADALADRLPAPVRNRLAARLGLGWQETRPLLALLIGLHDAGKAIPPFQAQHAHTRHRLRDVGLDLRDRYDLADQRHHGHATIPILHRWLDAASVCDTARPLLKVLSAFAGFHHGRVEKMEKWDNPSQLGNEAWRDQQQRLVAAVAEVWMETYGGWPDLSAAQEKQWGWPFPPEALAFAGWTTLADWVGSMSQHMPEDAISYTDLAAYLVTSRAAVHNALTETHLQHGVALRAEGTEADFKSCFPAVFRNGADLAPHPLQQLAATVELAPAEVPALVLIEAPTGEGKTEAAFYLAARLQARRADARGVYVALPTQATSNSLFPRFRDFLGEAHDAEAAGATPNLLLAHGASALNLDLEALLQPVDEDEAVRSSAYAARWFLPTKRSLLAPYGVGTVDQALLGAVTSRHFFLRLYGLAGKTVVFDEVHAYDGYMTALFCRLLQWLRCLGADVVVLSATLPRAMRRALLKAWGAPEVPRPKAYPALTVASASANEMPGRIVDFQGCFETSQFAEADVSFADSDPAFVARYVAAAVAEGATVGVILNRVDRAQDVFQEIQKLELDADLHLLHARFPFAARDRRERAVIERFGKHGRRIATRPAVLIATQVAEQSLDLDVDIMLSDLAPIDLLLQRAGRLHRHRLVRPPGYEQPRLVVLRPSLDGPHALPEVKTIGGQFEPDDPEAIYLNLPLFRTDLTLRERTGWSLPLDYRPLIEAVYGGDADAVPDRLSATDQDQWKAAVNAKKKLANIESATANWSMVQHPDRLEELVSSRVFADRTTYDEDDDTPTQDLRVQTRLGGPSVQVVCLHRHDGTLFLDAVGRTPLPLGPKLKSDEVRAVLHQAVRLSRKGVVHELKKTWVLPEPEHREWARVIQKTPALAFHHPIAFEHGRCIVGSTIIELHSQLGIRYNPGSP